MVKNIVLFRQLFIGFLLFFFGLLITITIDKVNDPIPLSNARENELVQLLTDLNRQNDQLTEEIAEQSSVLSSLESGSNQEANAAAINRANALGVLAGTKNVAGPGLLMTLTGDKAAVNAFTLLDAVQELRDAGSVAIQMNTVRIVANTWFVDTVGGISISGKVINPPIIIKVIGDPQTLETAMQIPGGFQQTIVANGGSIDIQKNNNVQIDATVTPVPLENTTATE